MTLGELLTKEGITLTNHDRNRIGILIGAKAKELDITKTRKEESNEGKHYTANDYDEAFIPQMLIIVKEFLNNPPSTVPPKKVKVEPTGSKQEGVAKIDANMVAPKLTKQQEWLEKRRNAK